MFVSRHGEEDDGGIEQTDSDGGGPDGMKRCPSCGDSFIATASQCPTCNVDLVGGDVPAVYTFLMGDDEAVAALERLMNESLVPHRARG